MADIPEAVISAAAAAIHRDACDPDADHEATGIDRRRAVAALEAAAPLLAEAWGVAPNGEAGRQRTTPPEGFTWVNAERSSLAGHRDAERARRALELLGPDCSQRMRMVAEARIASPDASWSELAGKLGLTKDQAAGLFRRLMHRLHVAQQREEQAGRGRLPRGTDDGAGRIGAPTRGRAAR